MKKLMLLCLFFTGLVQATPLNSVVIFGDSLSDNGNFYEFMKHRFPAEPYFNGRFTNGKVWVEYLTDTYYPANANDHLQDKAFGGAYVASDTEDSWSFTLKNEVNNYLLANDNKAGNKNLFIVWIGANDYLATPEDNLLAVDNVVSGIEQNLKRLINHGAKHVMVFNLPDLGRSPVAREINAEEKLTALVNLHNQKLLQVVNRLSQQHPRIQWLYFDINKEINELLASPESYGFNNILDSCYDTVLNTSMLSESLPYALLTAKPNPSTLSQVDSCDKHLFFDSVHPTTRAHEIIAQRARAKLDAAGVKFTP